MEQEPARELLSYTLRRVGYKLRLVAHLAFLIFAVVLVILTLAILLFTQ